MVIYLYGPLVARHVPCWSSQVPVSERCVNPLASATTTLTPSTIDHQITTQFNNQDASYFITGSPPEVVNTHHNHRDRTQDDQCIIETILTADQFVYLSVMDFIPSSLYTTLSHRPIWWPDLYDAIATVVTTKNVSVRVLVSRWAHTNPRIYPYLVSLLAVGSSCHVPAGTTPLCKGEVQVKLFEVPYWNATTGSEAKYPPFSRVNHAKYVVTDKRLNIGTSNLSWEYFTQTAGASFNTDHEGLRNALANTFMRDWESSYSTSLHASFTTEPPGFEIDI